MSYEPVPSHSFGGLNLRDAPDEVGLSGAIDCLNVDFDRPGAVRTRDGYDNLTSPALTNNVASLHPYYTTGGTKHILAGCGTRLEAVNTSGSVVASQTGLTTGTWDFARFGAPGSEVAYAGNGGNLMYKWNGSAWSSVATSPKSSCLAVMAVDQGNRLVGGGGPDSATAGPGGIQSYTSRVWFSNAGAPETWGATNYVDLTPGDGESIMAVIAWREFVIVFKESKYFVFYGTSTDSSGNPVFNYRTIDTGVGLASPRAVTTGPNGVYFMGRDGIYATTGGDPIRLTDPVKPIWVGSAWSFYGGGTIAAEYITNCALHHHEGRLYLAFPGTTTNNYMLVHDLDQGWFSVWDIAATSMASFRIGHVEELVFGYPGSNHIGRHSRSYTNDDSVAITSRYRTGFYDYGIEEQKTMREVKLWGTGTVALAYSKDFGALGSSTSVTLGSSPAIAMGLYRKAIQGTVFSHRYSSETAQWTIHRHTDNLRETRPTGMDT